MRAETADCMVWVLMGSVSGETGGSFSFSMEEYVLRGLEGDREAMGSGGGVGGFMAKGWAVKGSLSWFGRGE